MKPEIERDTIAWFRVGLVVTSALVGSALLISDARPAAYFFLGYALFGATVMLIFKTWRSSSEVEKANKSNWKRMVCNIPRGIYKFFLGYLSFIAVIAVGCFPFFFTGNDFYHAHEQLLNIYVYFLIAVSTVVFFWVGGFIKSTRQMFSDMKTVREAASRAKERRAREKLQKNER